MGLSVNDDNFTQSITSYHDISQVGFVALVIINSIIILLGITGTSLTV